jgi:oxidase EvaA
LEEGDLIDGQGRYCSHLFDGGAPMEVELEFLKSAFADEHTHVETDEVIKWLEEQNKKVIVNVEQINLNKIKQWGYDSESGSLKHDSGKFFSIDGISVDTNWGEINHWQQPIINQPEIGYLGFIVKSIQGVYHFLMQAKIEPGNVNYVQLSPTLQATRSNYTQVHKGAKPLYLEYFQDVKPDKVLLDQLQSEQGGRFLKKRNRNIIIEVEEDLTVHDNFIWLTLAQIKKLMHFDNLVNMDTRTVISGIPFGTIKDDVIDFLNFFTNKNFKNDIKKDFLKTAISCNFAINNIEEIITFLTHKKSVHDLEITKIHLDKVKDWIFTDKEIYHKDQKFFKIIGVNVEIANREVVKWNQPMIQPAQEGLCAFVCKKINGVLHFAVQAKLECGNFDIIELAPTVQCITGNYKQTQKGALPFLDYVLNVNSDRIIIDTKQSEEGGRFFREQNRNMIVIAGDEISNNLPPNYIWMTLNQLYIFLKFNNFLNIQARSLISAIYFI